MSDTGMIRAMSDYSSIFRLSRRAPPRRWRESGAAVILAAGFMLLAVSCLALVLDTGRLYFEKRRLQGQADLAALETAKRQGCLGSVDSLGIAREAASRNGFLGDGVRVECGSIETSDGARHFVAGADASGQTLAVHVMLEHPVPASLVAGGIWGGQVNLQASAVALRTEPVVAFRVGSRLLNTNGTAPLMQVLKLVGVNLDGTTVASYEGLAGVKITPDGLLKALGLPLSADLNVGELNGLLVDSQVALGPLLDVIVELADQDHLLGVNLTLLTAIKAQLGVDDLKVRLGSDATRRGLFAEIATASGLADPALGVEVSALDLLNAAVGIGTGENALALDVGVRVIEPPSVGIGGVGAHAYTGQVRVYVDLDTGNMVDNPSLTGVLLGGLLQTRIKLPIILDVVNAYGEVTKIDCAVFPRKVDIKVTSSVLNACIGHAPGGPWSKTDICTNGLQDEMLVKLLTMNLVRGQVALPALVYEETVTLEYDPNDPDNPASRATTGPNDLKLGTTLAKLVDEVLKLLALKQNGQPEQMTPAEATEIADAVLAKGPAGSGGNYSWSDLDAIRKMLRDNGLNWDRPAFLFTGDMATEWRDKTREFSVSGGCYAGVDKYGKACARQILIDKLQTEAKPGFLEWLLGGLVGGVVQPLLGAILQPLMQLLSPLLDGVGFLLSKLLSDVLGLELGRTDVWLDSVNCGDARLVI
jgi:uncharacterized membrane protein